MRSTHDTKRIDIGIARVDKHASYSTFLVFHTNDIALVHLKHDVELMVRIQIIAFIFQNDLN